MNIVDRLKIYMEHIGLPISQFADTAQIPRPTLSQILSGRNKKISNEILEKLHAAFPSLNISWLLFGDGEIEKKGNPTASMPNVIEAKPKMPIPPAQCPPIKSEEKVAEAIKSQPVLAAESNDPQIALAPDANKKIQTIMVFYTDNSFEIFTPSQR